MLAAAVALTTPAAAEVPAGGCFERTYSADHLKRNPGQQVRRLIVRIGKAYTGDITFGAQAWLRNKPQSWKAGGPCGPTDGGWTCQPDTDGDPPITIERQAKTIRLVVPSRLKMVDDRTGPDLNEVVIAGPSDRVFVLSPAAAGACRLE